MFRLKVWASGSWRWGLITYASREAAENRVKELKAVGIKAKIAKNEELFN